MVVVAALTVAIVLLLRKRRAASAQSGPGEADEKKKPDDKSSGKSALNTNISDEKKAQEKPSYEEITELTDKGQLHLKKGKREEHHAYEKVV